MGVRAEAFLALERSLAARLMKSWTKVAESTYRRVSALVAQSKWDDATDAVENIDLSPIFNENKSYIRYSIYSSLLFGASRLQDDLKSSIIVRGQYDDVVGKVLKNIKATIDVNVGDQVKDVLHEMVEAAYANDATTPIGITDILLKYNPYHDWRGRFARKPYMFSGNLKGKWVPLENDELTEEDEARMKALRVPPAWKNVLFSKDAKSDLQVIGTDSKGRTQYIYSAAHTAKAAAEKFARLKDFHKAVPKIRKKALNDMQDESLSQEERDTAAVIYLIDKTAFRIGSDSDTLAAKRAYGASTLLGRHVKVEGDKVVFRFVGKKGVEINKTIRDASLASYINGKRVKRDDKLFATSDARTRDYLKSITGEPFLVKDFRTWHGTAMALKTIKSMKVPTTQKDFLKARREVCKKVSDHLGNTPAVALASYIDPTVWAPWTI